MNRAILGELFHDAYEIIKASNGRDALALLETYRENALAVLSDAAMPVIDGLEMPRILKQRGWIKSIPVNNDNRCGWCAIYTALATIK